MTLYKKKVIAVIPVIIFFIALDRLLKSLSLYNYFNSPIRIIDDIITLNFTSNYNIAFSLPLSGWWLNILIALIIICLIYYMLYLLSKNVYIKQIFFLSLIILGATSNLFDRIKYGYVIDYIDIKYFTVFNIVDMMIVGGVIGLIYNSLRKNNLKQRNA